MIDALTGWDWFVGTVALVSIGLGLWRGMVRTIFALSAWVAALLGTPLLMCTLLPWWPAAAPPAVLAVLLFLALLIGVRMLGGLAARALHGVGLGGIDRLLGAALGTARALIIVLLVALAAHLNGMSKEAAWQQAWTRPLLDLLVSWAEPFLPERLSGIRQT